MVNVRKGIIHSSRNTRLHALVDSDTRRVQSADWPQQLFLFNPVTILLDLSQTSLCNAFRWAVRWRIIPTNLFTFELLITSVRIYPKDGRLHPRYDELSLSQSSLHQALQILSGLRWKKLEPYSELIARPVLNSQFFLMVYGKISTQQHGFMLTQQSCNGAYVLVHKRVRVVIVGKMRRSKPYVVRSFQNFLFKTIAFLSERASIVYQWSPDRAFHTCSVQQYMQPNQTTSFSLTTSSYDRVKAPRSTFWCHGMIVRITNTTLALKALLKPSLTGVTHSTLSKAYCGKKQLISGIRQSALSPRVYTCRTNSRFYTVFEIMVR